MEKNINNFLGVSMDKIKQMVDVNTVVGDPIALPDGITLIPVSRMSYGFAAGGSDLPNKADRDIFGGGTGAGINVTPVAFLVVKDGEVKMLPVNSHPDSVDRVVSMVPDVVDKVTGLFKKKTVADETPAGEQVSEIVIEE